MLVGKTTTTPASATGSTVDPTSKKGSAMALLDAVLITQHLQDTLRMTPAQLARVLDVNPRTVTRWIDERAIPQKNHGREELEELTRLTNFMLELFETLEEVQAWLYADNRYLGMIKPAEVLLAGRMDRV